MLRSAALACVVLLSAVVGFAGTTAGRVWWAARKDDRAHADAIVVLGASQFDGRPSPVYRARLAHAKQLYDDGVARTVVTVGGKLPGDRFTEGSAGRTWLVDRGVPANAVIKVEEGSDTLESVRAVHDVFRRHHWDTAVLVTDPWHSLRSRTMARDAGIEAWTSPTRRGPMVRARSTELRYVARETTSLLYYRIFGHSPAHSLPV